MAVRECQRGGSRGFKKKSGLKVSVGAAHSNEGKPVRAKKGCERCLSFLPCFGEGIRTGFHPCEKGRSMEFPRETHWMRAASYLHVHYVMTVASSGEV